LSPVGLRIGNGSFGSPQASFHGQVAGATDAGFFFEGSGTTRLVMRGSGFSNGAEIETPNGPLVLTTNNFVLDASGRADLSADDGVSILSSDFSVGQFSATGLGNGQYFNQISLSSSRNNVNSRTHVAFYNPNGLVGQIRTSGSSTAYDTSSDYRLKENERPIENAIERFKQIQFYDFNFIADKEETLSGVFAHELQEVVPSAVSGEKDGEEMQAVDYSKIVPLMGAALQKLTDKVESLEAEVRALKAARS